MASVLSQGIGGGGAKFRSYDTECKNHILLGWQLRKDGGQFGAEYITVQIFKKPQKGEF